MRWILEVAYIAATTSWKWLIGSTAVAGVLIGVLFSIGIIGGENPDLPSESIHTTPISVEIPKSRLEVPGSDLSEVQPVRFISIPILATQAENVGSLEFELTYDEAKVELTEVKPGLLSEDALVDSSSPGPGRLWTGIIAINGMTGSGSVAVMKFKIKDDVQGTMPLSLERIAAYDASTLVDIITENTAGAFNIVEFGALSPIVTFH